MTPFNTTNDMRYRERYNTALCRTRVLIEQTYGILKRRFPCLAVGLRTDPGRACQYVVACVVLHNVGILRQDIVTLSLDDLTIAGPDILRRVQQRERSLSHSTVANSDVLNGSERSPLEPKWCPIGNKLFILKFLKVCREM